MYRERERDLRFSSVQDVVTGFHVVTDMQKLAAVVHI